MHKKFAMHFYTLTLHPLCLMSFIKKIFDTEKGCHPVLETPGFCEQFWGNQF